MDVRLLDVKILRLLLEGEIGRIDKIIKDVRRS